MAKEKKMLVFNNLFSEEQKFQRKKCYFCSQFIHARLVLFLIASFLETLKKHTQRMREKEDEVEYYCLLKYRWL